MLKSPDDLLKHGAEYPLSAINDATPEGRQVLAAARQILANLYKEEAAVVTLEDATDTAKIFAQTQFNGDGIIPADSAEDAAPGALYCVLLLILLLALGWAAGKFDNILSSVSPRTTSSWVIHHQAQPESAAREAKPPVEEKE